MATLPCKTPRPTLVDPLKELVGTVVEDLTLPELQFVREACRRGGDTSGLKIENGQLLMTLSDDVNPPGWYVYRPWEGETVESLRDYARRERARRFRLLQSKRAA